MKRNKRQARKMQREYIAKKLIRCSIGYLGKKLDRLNTSVEEILKSKKLEDKRKHLACFNEDVFDLAFTSDYLNREAKQLLKEIYVVDSEGGLVKTNHAALNCEMERFLEDRMLEIKNYHLINSKNSVRIDVSVVTVLQKFNERIWYGDERRIEIYVQLVSEKGKLKFLYPNPITRTTEELPIKTTRNGFIINGNKFLLLPYDVAKLKITNKNFKKIIENKLHKPLSLGRDQMGWFIKAGEIIYHIGGRTFCSTGWKYRQLRGSDLESLHNFGYRIVKDCITNIKRRKEAEKQRILESKYKEIIYSNLDKLFLDFQTSRNVGNCEPGTQELYTIAREKLHLGEKDGDCAIRADIIKDIVSTTHKHFESNFDNLLFSIARQTKLVKNIV